MGWVATAAALMAQAASASAGPLLPGGKWALDYAENACVVTRTFGRGADALTFGYRPFPTSLQGDLLLIRPLSGGPRQERGRGEIVLQPSGARFPTEWAHAAIGAKATSVLRLRITDELGAALARSTGLTIDAGQTRRIALSTGRLDRLAGAVKACQDNLLRHWGADPAAMVEAPETAWRWFRPEDYPVEAMRQGQGGRVVALVAMDRSGLPSLCKVVEQSGHAALDRATCATVRRNARMGVLGTGGPITRWMLLPVIWSLPG